MNLVYKPMCLNKCVPLQGEDYDRTSVFIQIRNTWKLGLSIMDIVDVMVTVQIILNLLLIPLKT